MADLFPIGSSQNWIGSKGTVKEWNVSISTIKGYLEVVVTGRTITTDVTVSLIPNFYLGTQDGRSFPDTRTGNSNCAGLNGTSTIRLKSQSSYPDSNNIPDFYLPRGDWQLKLTANENSQVQVQVSHTALTEEVSVPSKPEGPASALQGSSCTYKIGGSVHNQGHPIQYQVDWGDGSVLSTWTDSTSSDAMTHTFTKSGAWQVKARARCKTHPTSTVTEYGAYLTTVVGTALETVSTPTTPSGTQVGIISTTYTYNTGGSTNSLGHPIEYRLEWGDSTYSSWETTPIFTHSWTTAGTYQVRAHARCQTHSDILATPSGWLPVSISGGGGEVITKPVAPTGISTGVPNVQYTFTTAGTTSSLTHALEYRFDWGDGSYSGWSTALSSTKTWTISSPTGSPYQVRVQARCVTHTTVSSEWSDPLSVTISLISETITQPSKPSGQINGQVGTSYTYTITPTTSSQGHSLEYQIDWADGSKSAWSQNTSVTKTWNASGSYSITVTARCSQHTTITSVPSQSLLVTMTGETISTPSTPSGPTTGSVNVAYNFTSGGSASSLTHTIEYQFDWGDSSSSEWMLVPATTHAWTTNGTKSIRCRARCKDHPTVYSSWSSTTTIAIDVTSGTSISFFNSVLKGSNLYAGYAFGCYDPKGFVYYAPCYVNYNVFAGGNSIHGNLLRYSTSGDFTATTSWEVVNMRSITGLGSWAGGYHGAIYYDDWIYLVPLFDDSSGQAFASSRMVRFYTGGNNRLNDSANWETYDLGTNPTADGLNILLRGFVQGFEAKGYIYYTPWCQGKPGDASYAIPNGKVLRFNANSAAAGQFTSSARWEYVDLTSFSSFSSSIGSESIGSITIVNGGSGYVGGSSFQVSGGYEIASGTITVSGGAVTGFTFSSYGKGYKTGLSYSVYIDGGGSGGQFTANVTTVRNSVPATDHTCFHGGCYDGERFAYFGQHQKAGGSNACTSGIWQLDCNAANWHLQTSWKFFDPARLSEDLWNSSSSHSINSYGMVAIGGVSGKVYSANNSSVSDKGFYVRCVNPLSFDQISSWQIVDIGNVAPSSILPWPQVAGTYDRPNKTAAGVRCAGICTDGSYVYFAPDVHGIDNVTVGGASKFWQTSGIALKHQISSGSMTEGWYFCDLTRLKDLKIQGHHGIVTDGTYGYLIGISLGLANPTEPPLTNVASYPNRLPHGVHTKILLSDASIWTPGTTTLSETLTAPNAPTGTTDGYIGVDYTYTATGGSSSQGHAIQYQFNWGDGTSSSWLPVGTLTATKQWSTNAVYPVKVRCRCESHGVESPWSLSITVNVQKQNVSETMYAPSNLSGETSVYINVESKYYCTIQKTSLNHDVQIKFEWGDGTDTGWLPKTINFASHAWSGLGTKVVKCKARCSIDTGNESSYSNSLTVIVNTPGVGATYRLDSGIIDVSDYVNNYSSGYATQTELDTTYAKNNGIGTASDTGVILVWDGAYNNSSMNTIMDDIVAKLKAKSLNYVMGLDPTPAAFNTFQTSPSTLVSSMVTQLNSWFTKAWLLSGQIAKVYIDVEVDLSYPYVAGSWLNPFKDFMIMAVNQLYSAATTKGATGIDIWFGVTYEDLKGIRQSKTAGDFQTEYISVLNGIGSATNMTSLPIRLFSCLKDGTGTYNRSGVVTNLHGTRQPGDADYTSMVNYIQAHYNAGIASTYSAKIKCKSISEMFQYVPSIIISQTSGGTDETIDHRYEAVKFNTGSYTSFDRISLRLKRDVGVSSGTIKVMLYENNGTSNKPSTKKFESSSYQYYIVGTSYTEVEFDLIATGLTAATNYWIVIDQQFVGGNLYIDRM